MNRFIILLLCVSGYHAATALDTLDSLVTFVAAYPEDPPHEEFNYLDLSYKPFFNQYKKSPVRRFAEYLLSYVGMRPTSGGWPVYEFEKLLNSLVSEREKNNLNEKHVVKIIPSENDQFIVWGDVQGAIHSLIRDLQELKRMGIIDNSLKIVSPDNYFIFNGDLISRSAYSLETLVVVMMLMSNNPRQVYYIKGNHETGRNWHDYGLKRELQIKARGISDDKIPFDSLVRRFFKTLPYAVFIEGIDKKTNGPAFVRVSHFNVTQKKFLHEDSVSNFLLNTQKENPSIYFPKQPSSSPKFADIKANIQGISRSTTYRPTDGLEMLIPEQGATSWTVLSSPTHTYNKLYKFFNDSFAILKVKKFINQWTITLYTQDIRKKDGFNESSYHLLSGQKLSSPDQILNLEEIVVGSINDMTKSTSTLGQSLREGLSLRINKANKSNEIPGKYIRIVFLDDEYTPHKTVNAMKRIKAKYGSDIILTTLGTPTQEALLPYIKDKSIAVLFGYSGAGKFRKPDLTNTVHYRTAYEREAYVLVEYAVKELRMKRFAIVYQDDAFGKALRDGARVALNKFDCNWVEGSYPRNTLNINNAATTIKEFDPEVILLFGTRAPSYALIQKLGIPYVADKQLMGGSFLTDAFRYMVEPRGLALTITRVVPDPHSDVPIAQEFKKEVFELNPDDFVSVDSFEGYINASLFIEALKHIKGPITKESLMNYFHTLQDQNFKGLALRYDPNTQELSRDQEVFIDDGKKWTPLSGKGWKHLPEKALPPKKNNANSTSASLYVPNKKGYTDTQLMSYFITPNIEQIVGTDHDSIKAYYVSTCLGMRWMER